MNGALTVPYSPVQPSPQIIFGLIPGRWLLDHSTPSWRKLDPERGFQRIVDEKRARQIASAVLDQGRTFPNAIVLATDRTDFKTTLGQVELPGESRYLVVDGQHRLWAQRFSEVEAQYPCMIHLGLTEVQMANLFLEINDNQKRVPSSLRWDLVRLVRPEDDVAAVATSELIFQMATTEKHPLFQRIDLTGEQPTIGLKQGSLAPEIHTLLRNKKSPLHDLEYDVRFDIFTRYLTAIQALDKDGWKSGSSIFYQARILRALFRLLPQIVAKSKRSIEESDARLYSRYLSRIDPSTLSVESIRGLGGTGGLKAIVDLIRLQIFPSQKS